MALHQIVYISSSVEPLQTSQLAQMLRSFRARNEGAGITGIMLYSDRRIMQCLEGPPEQVQPLFERIRADRRHTLVTPLVDGPTPERQFAGWSMAFPMEASDFVAAEVEGYEDLKSLDFDRSPGANAKVALRMLKHFRDYLERKRK